MGSGSYVVQCDLIDHMSTFLPFRSAYYGLLCRKRSPLCKKQSIFQRSRMAAEYKRFEKPGEKYLSRILLTLSTFIMYRVLTVAAGFLALTHGQLVGTEQTETHPGMTWQSCTAKGSCTSKSGKVVVDANWRWLHVKGGFV
jgi:hypothetical protein